METSRREFLRNCGTVGLYLVTASVIPGCRSTGVFDALSHFLNETQFTVDVNDAIGPCDARLWGNIAFDQMYATTVAPETRPVWAMIRESKAFRYVRCHNTFSDASPDAKPEKVMGCRVYTEDKDGRPHYNFQYLDQVLDIWTDAGLKPILEMDFMPDSLAEGEIVRNYGGGAINPPRDLNKWRGLCHKTASHLTERYGPEEVRSWYFEIWNEPDLKTYWLDGALINVNDASFTQATMQRFLMMYDYFVDGVKSADERLRVGGPGLAKHDEFFKLFLEHVTNGRNAATGKRGTRTDFISWHAYGNSGDIFGKNWSRSWLVRSYPELDKAELHHTEWGQELLPDDNSPNLRVSGEYDAAFLCRNLDNQFTYGEARVDMFARWGDLINGWRPLFRQFGSQLLPLPIFHAYALLGQLGPERIAVHGLWSGSPIRAFAARRGRGQAQVMVYHFDEGNPQALGEALEVELRIHGLARATGPVTVYRVDRDHANAYRAWVAIGSPVSLTASHVGELASRTKLTSETVPVKIEGGEISMTLSLPPNGLALVLVGENAGEGPKQV